MRGRVPCGLAPCAIAAQDPSKPNRGRTRPTTPTTTVKRATSNAAILIGGPIRAAHEGLPVMPLTVAPYAADLWVQASLEQRQRFQQRSFQRGFLSTETALFEPPQPHRLSAT